MNRQQIYLIVIVLKLNCYLMHARAIEKIEQLQCIFMLFNLYNIELNIS